MIKQSNNFFHIISFKATHDDIEVFIDDKEQYEKFLYDQALFKAETEALSKGESFDRESFLFTLPDITYVNNTLNEEQQTRLNEVNNFNFPITLDEVKEYVLEGKNPSTNIAFELKKIKEENKTLIASQKTKDQLYKELNKEVVSLEELKKAKMDQLDEACNRSITEGFDYNVDGVSYRFSCSLSAQANFQGTDSLFKDGLITETDWTVLNNTTKLVERITIDRVVFDQLKLAVFTHINSNIVKLRNELQLLVESALTKEEIDLINW